MYTYLSLESEVRNQLKINQIIYFFLEFSFSSAVEKTPQSFRLTQSEVPCGQWSQAARAKLVPMEHGQRKPQ